MSNPTTAVQSLPTPHAPITSPEARAAARFRAHAVSLVVTVCVGIFCIKAVVAQRDLSPVGFTPHIYVAEDVRNSLGRVLLCSAEDFAVGLACLLALLAARKLPLLRRYPRGLLFAANCAAAACLAWMVMNAQLFHVLRRYLNYSQLQYAGGTHLEGSIYAYATVELKAALAAVPILALAVHLAGVRFLPFVWRFVARVLTYPDVFVALAALQLGAAHAVQTDWFPEDNYEYATNPHWRFVYSCGRCAGSIDFDAPEDADESDFRPGRFRPARRPQKRPITNVVLVVVESINVRNLELYGSPLPTTPRLRELANRGLVFDNFSSTATYSPASGLVLFGSVYNDPRDHATILTSPDVPVPSAAAWLKERGYRTYFLGTGYDGHWDVAHQFLRGFDVARDGLDDLGAESRDWPFLGERYGDEELFRDGLRCVEEARGGKFFLMLWNYDTHSPYRQRDCPVSFDKGRFPSMLVVPTDRRGPQHYAAAAEKRDDYNRYVENIWRADRLIGGLYDRLEGLGLAESTLIVVTGDHGEGWGEHGWFGHAYTTLHQEVVHVPLVLISPGLRDAGTRSVVVGSHIDVWPTIMDVCGLECDPRWQGRSLLSEEDPDERRAYFSRTGALGVREGNYKYTWDYLAGREQLFDLAADPGETKNLAAEHRDYCLVQRRRVMTWVNYQSRLLRERTNEARR
jgi:arylsulfatase A-like enzyme